MSPFPFLFPSLPSFRWNLPLSTASLLHLNPTSSHTDTACPIKSAHAQHKVALVYFLGRLNSSLNTANRGNTRTCFKLLSYPPTKKLQLKVRHPGRSYFCCICRVHWRALIPPPLLPPESRRSLHHSNCIPLQLSQRHKRNPKNYGEQLTNFASGHSNPFDPASACAHLLFATSSPFRSSSRPRPLFLKA